MRSLVMLILLVPLSAIADPVDESLYSCKPRPAEVEITMKPEVELKELMTWVIGFTCKRFVLDPRIVSTGKKVTLMAPGKMSPSEAYDMFLVSLATMGLTVVPKGKLMRVVEAAQGKGQTVPIYVDKLPPATDQIVRYMLRAKYVQAEVLSKAIGTLKSDAGDLQVTGTLVVVTDHGSHVRDMVSIARLVDVPGTSDGIYTIPIMHADATKLSEKLTTLLGVAAACMIGIV
jgi:general secretion pathway protein D